jgi:SAM-dependent methyltransferase
MGAGVSALLLDLVADGYESIDAVDLSSAALERLRERLGAAGSVVRFVQADIRSVVLDGPVDVWHDRATFHFLTDPLDQAKYVQRVQASVAPGGHVVLATFAPDGPEQCSGLPVARHSPASLAALFDEQFELIDASQRLHATPWGARQSFTHALLARRP